MIKNNFFCLFLILILFNNNYVYSNKKIILNYSKLFKINNNNNNNCNFLNNVCSSLVLIKSRIFSFKNIYYKYNNILNFKYYLNFLKYKKYNNNFNFYIKKNNFFKKKNRSYYYSFGTGIIIDNINGYIITNSHVIDMSNDILIKLNDGREYSAFLVGQDKYVDIAVLKIKNFKNINSIKIGNSDNLYLGEKIFSLGYPYNLNLSITSGIISGLNRNNIGIQKYENFIQTDSLINSGNSGGALINIKGELIGINTAALVSNNGNNLGISFSIPINMIKNIVNQIIKIGESKHINFGFFAINIDNNIKKIKNIYNNFGVFITYIKKNSLFNKYKIFVGDIILFINNKFVLSLEDLNYKLSTFLVGDYINIGLLRKNKLIYKKIFLFNDDKNIYNFDILYNNFKNLGLTTYNYLNLNKNNIYGVYISKILNNNNFFKIGDIIININNKNINNLLDLRKILYLKPKFILIKLLRNRKFIYYYLK